MKINLETDCADFVFRFIRFTARDVCRFTLYKLFLFDKRFCIKSFAKTKTVKTYKQSFAVYFPHTLLSVECNLSLFATSESISFSKRFSFARRCASALES